MKPLPSQPWRRITDLPNGIGVITEWRDFPSTLLQVMQEPASAIPCDRHAGCYMNVVEHAPGDIIGVCTSDAQRCAKRVLKKQEVAAYRLNHSKLFSYLASAIGFVASTQQIGEVGKLWRLGQITPQGQMAFPVYCFLGHSVTQIDKAFHHVCLIEPLPFLLVVPYGLIASPASHDAAMRRQSKIIGLDDALNIQANGAIVAKPSLSQLLDGWLSHLLPKTDKPSEDNRFPTPAGTSWKDITITFLARDIISIKCGNETAVNYERLHIPGMFVASQREKKPTDRWFLLMAFALWGPTLNRENLRTLYRHDDWNRMRTQKSSLSKSLKQFFGLDEEPITYDKKAYEYQPILRIRQDTNCDLNDWIADIHE